MSITSEVSLTLQDSASPTQSVTLSLEEQEPLSVDTASGLVTTWALGIEQQADGSVTGYYDVHKTWSGDNQMCWAASASNLIAWWQDYYGTVDYAVSTPPTDVDSIFNAVKLAWRNQGGNAVYAWDWWLAGDVSDAGSLYMGTGDDAGYYSDKYTASNVGNTSEYVNLSGFSASEVADVLLNYLQNGAGISLSGARWTGKGWADGHAITLWGVTVDSETGYLTSIHVTDSDDTWKGLYTMDVQYDALSGYYSILGSRSQYKSLRGFSVLKTYENTATLSAPTGLSCTVNGNEVSLSWAPVAGATDVYYQVYVAGQWICTTETSLTATVSEAGDYWWRVYAYDYLGNSQSTFGNYFDIAESLPTTPTFSLFAPSLNVVTTGQTAVTIKWDGSTGDNTYELKINGETVFAGAEISYTYTAADGIYEYTVTAISNATGATTTHSGWFECDTVNPTTPTKLAVEVQDGQAVFSWKGSTDANRIHYMVGYRVGGGDYSYGVSSGETLTLELTEQGLYEWHLYARDSVGNWSDYAWGEAFVYDTLPPELTFNAPVHSKQSEGLSRVTLSWSSNEEATYTLVVAGKNYELGSASEYTLTLMDGTYSYSVTATDSLGQSSVFSASVSCDATAPTLPTALSVARQGVQGVQAILSWAAAEDASGVSYELRYRVAGAASYTTKSLSTTSHTLELAADGCYEWAIRAVDASGNATAWVEGDTFIYDTTGPALTLGKPLRKRVEAGLVEVTFNWQADEGASYILSIKGETYDVGSATSYTLILADGTHAYSVIATDALGNSSTTADSVTCDSSIPDLELAAPVLSKVSEGRVLVTLNWSGESGATYQLVVDGELVYSGAETSYTAVLADGDHSYEVTVLSGFNEGVARGESFSYDATAPTLSFSTPTLSKTAEGKTAVTLSWVCSEDASYTLVINGQSYELGSATSHTIILPDGSYEYSVTATDAAGNSSTLSDSLLADATAPELTLNIPTQKAATSGHVKVTFRWSSDEAATYTLEVNGQTYDAGTATQYTLTLPDGSYDYRVTASDSFGNTSTTTGSLFCDITAPAAPSYLRVQVKEGAAHFSWLGVQDVSGVSYTLAYRLEGASTYRYETVADSALSLTLPLEGNYEWQLRAEDGAGNASAWVSGSDFSYDVTGPKLRLSKPTLSKAAEGMVKVTLAWETNESGVSYELVVNGETVYSGTKSSYVLTLPDGEYSYSVIAADASGNKTTKTSSFTCDMAAPVLSNLQSEIGEDGSVTLSWACSEAAEYVIKLGKETFYPGGDTSYSLKLKDGKYSYTITATDGSGLKGTAKGSFVVDTIAPKIAFKEPKYKNLGNGLVQASLSWKGESKASYTLLVDGEEAYSGTKTSCKLTLAEGSHSYTLIATDAAGNQSETPALTLSAPAWEKTAEGQIAASFSWAGEAGSSYLLTVDGKKYNLTGTSYTLALKDGKHKYSLAATDAAGNSSVLAGEFVADAKAPKLSLSKPKAAKPVDGLTAVQFKWSAEKGANCVLTVAGQSYQLEGKSYTVSLGHGEHEYSITATDAAGNTSVQTSVISVDGLAPEVTLGKAETVSVKKGKVQLTLSWVGEDGASYTLMGGSKKAYSGKKATCKLTLSEGVYNYNLLATDKAGNTSTLETQLVVDATGQVSWSTLDSELALSAGSYALPVDAACAPASLAELALQEQKTGLGMLA